MTKKKKSARNSFLCSVLAICLTFTMFAATTFAWFTESVESGRNTIIAGSMEMVLQHFTGGANFTNGTWEDVGPTTEVFSDSNSFEPGATQVAYVRVKNTGDLAFKYRLSIAVDSETIGKNKAGGDIKLSEVLYYGTATPANNEPYADRAAAISAVSGTSVKVANAAPSQGQLLQSAATSDVIAIVIYMPENTGNDANPDPNYTKPRITFGLNAVATQYTHETDSFGNDYDTLSAYPGHSVAATNATVTGSAASFTSSAVPVSGTNNETTVAITSLDNVNDSDTLTLTVDTTDLTTSAGNSDFEVAEGSTAVAGIDLTLKDSNDTAVTFDGGEATITLKHKNTVMNYTVRIPVVEHGDLYYFFSGTEYDQDRNARTRDFYYKDGVLQDERCDILEIDEKGNLFQGHLAEGLLTLKRNGTVVAKDKPISGEVAKHMAKGGKFYMITNDWVEFLHPGESAHCYILDEKDKWRDIDLDVTDNHAASTAGSLYAIDEDSDGHIIVWGGITQGENWWVTYPHIWRVKSDNSSICTIAYHHDDTRDWDMGSASDAMLDANGNMLYLFEGEVWNCGRPDDAFAGSGWRKPGSYLYTITERAEIVNWGRKIKMIVRGNDVWVATCEIVRQGEEWWDRDFAVIVYKNGIKQFMVARSGAEENFGGIDLCVTPSGNVYTIHTNVTSIFIAKNGKLIRVQPRENANAPSLAVVE